MAGILSNFRNTIILSVVLAMIMIIAYSQVSPQGMNAIFLQAVFRWMHVVFGILWIGLLYYFNFVQIRKMPDIPAELKPAVSKYIAPEALFWFRWAALFTVLAGIGVAVLRGREYAEKVFSFGFAGGYTAMDRGYTLMGIGVWLAIIMFLNVWGINLAKPEGGPGHQGRHGRGARAKAARIASARLAHQHPAEPADADLHGHVPDLLRHRHLRLLWKGSTSTTRSAGSTPTAGSPVVLSATRARGPMSSRSMRLTISSPGPARRPPTP